MREEISEPQHWRARSERTSQRNNSWSSRRRAQGHGGLSSEVVDAALEQTADETPSSEKPNPNEIIQSLTQHLQRLEQQSEQIQKLLDQAQGM